MYQKHLIQSVWRLACLLIALMAFCTLSTAQPAAQEINFCGVHVQPGGSTSNGGQGLVIHDRFGNIYSLEEMLWHQSQGQANCSAGIFQLNFIGNFPADEEATICQVFQDLSSIIAGGSTVQVPINIVREPMSYGNAATATDFFLDGCGLVNSSALQLIRTGGNGLPFGLAAGVVHIQQNPTPATTWFSLEDEQSAQINSTQVDLYSVTMHEALHILGFASRIGLNGTSLGGDNIYSNWDKFLTAGSNHLIIPNPNGGPCCGEHVFNAAVFPGMPQPLSGGCGINAQFTKGGNNIAPVNIAGLVPTSNNDMANKLSHLDISCGTDNYVMNSGIAAGVIRRSVTNAERQILCHLGYDTGACAEYCTAIAQDDNTLPPIILAGQGANNPLFVPFATLLLNDAVPDGVSVNLIQGCGLNNGLTITPQATGFLIAVDPAALPGLRTFCYSITGCNNTTCDEAEVRITVLGALVQTNCITPDCNLVCFGDFENFQAGENVFFNQTGLPYFGNALANGIPLNQPTVLRELENNNAVRRCLKIYANFRDWISVISFENWPCALKSVGC